jgi:hypothetical protein
LEKNRSQDKFHLCAGKIAVARLTWKFPTPFLSNKDELAKRQALALQAVLRQQRAIQVLIDYTTRTTIADRNNALKILEWTGFDYELVEDLQGYMVNLPKFAKYAQILKNSVASKETATERIFLMKDLAAVEEAVSLGAEKMEGDVAF